MYFINKQFVIDAFYKTFCYAYCDNCDNLGKDTHENLICDYCHRKNIEWAASKEVIEKVINNLPFIEIEEKMTQIDCPMNNTECDENCEYYSKLLLKCPLKGNESHAERRTDG